jgi:hypothetical protein
MFKFNNQLIYLFLICILLTSCISPDQRNVSKDNNLPRETATVVHQNPEGFVIEAHFDKSPANDGKAVILWASLIRNGAILSGIGFHATWPDPSVKRGINRCDDMVNYGRGVCNIYTHNLTPGVYVPVSIEFQINDQFYYSETGFIP